MDAHVIKNLKMIQKRFLKEIDNYAVLLSYGIQGPPNGPR